MQASKLTDDLSVRGQISAEDLATAKEAGFTTIVCNRPDGEKPDQPDAEEIRAAAEAAGLQFHYNPISPGGVTPDAVQKQGQIIRQAQGNVLAYCGSGQRATVLWMLSNPHDMSADERIERAAAAGYDLAGLRPQL
ncbi:MAG: TIGR01244 family sulfur transferase [Qipengyuania vulgaris]